MTDKAIIECELEIGDTTSYAYDNYEPDTLYVASMPRGAEIMTITVYDCTPHIVALANQKHPLEKGRYCICGVGRNPPANVGQYVGKFFISSWREWYVFKLGDE